MNVKGERDAENVNGERHLKAERGTESGDERTKPEPKKRHTENRGNRDTVAGGGGGGLARARRKGLGRRRHGRSSVGRRRRHCRTRRTCTSGITREEGRRRGSTAVRGRGGGRARRVYPPTPARSIRVHGYTRAFRARRKGRGVRGMAGPRGWTGMGRGGGRERRHVAHTPSRRRLRLRGAYQPPSIISMRISIFHPVFPKFMQTSSPVLRRSPRAPLPFGPTTGAPSTLVFCHTPARPPIHPPPLFLCRCSSLSLPPSLALSSSAPRVRPFSPSRNLPSGHPLAARCRLVAVLFGMCVGPIHLTSSSELSHHDAPRTSSSRGEEVYSSLRRGRTERGLTGVGSAHRVHHRWPRC